MSQHIPHTHPEPTTRIALVAFALLLIFLISGAVWFAGPGTLRMDTRLADMGPLDTHNSVSSQGLESVAQARELASRQLSVHLESSDSGALITAHDAVRDAIAAIDGLQHRSPAERMEQLVDLLAPHRFSLLPASDQLSLDQGEETQIVDQALSALFSPSVAPRPLELHSDPTNSFGRWLIERVPQQLAPDEQPTQVRIDAQLADSVTNADAVVEQWLLARETLEQQHPLVILRHTGVPLFAHEAAARSRADVNWITIGSLVGITVLLLPVFRSIWPLVLPALSIAIGAATGFVLIALIQPSVHVLTLVFGASLIGIVIDYSVHGFVHQTAPDPNTARPSTTQSGITYIDGSLVGSAQARRGTGLLRALGLSLATSAAAYAALGMSGVPALSSVAIFSVGGLLGAWLTVVALLPLVTRHARPLRPGLIRYAVPVLLWSGRSLSPARALAWCLLIVAIGVIVLLGRADDDPRRLIDLSPELVADAQAIAETWPEINGSELLVLEADSIEQIYQSLNELRDAVGPGATITSLMDWLPSPAEQEANRARSARVLADGGPAEQVLSELGSESISERLARMRDTLTKDTDTPLDAVALLRNKALGLPPLLARTNGQYVALALLSAATESGVDPGVARGAEHTTAEVYAAERDGVTLMNAVADTEAALGRQREASFTVLAAGFAIVAMVLLIVYRRPGVLVILGVPAGAVIGTLAILALLGTPLTLFHAVGLFLVLGLGMDYAIFLNELDATAPDATRLAIVLSAATSLISFGVLALSSIPVARFFGQTVFIGNALNLVFSFALLAYLETRVIKSDA
jgi:predicted exporter